MGDPGQSIYLFRNADPEVFARRLKNYGQAPLELDRNHRSRPELVWFFNDFFNSKKCFLKFSEPKDCSHLLGSSKTSLCSSEDAFSDEPKLIKGTVQTELPFVYFVAYPKDSQASVFQQIFKHIQRLVSMGENYSDMAILSNRNKDLRALSLFLTERQIPVLLHSASGFSRQRILLDSLFLYRFLINPYDRENLTALLRTPCFCVSDESLSFIVDNFEKKGSGQLWEHCLKNFSSDKSVKSLKELLDLRDRSGLVSAFEEAVFKKFLPYTLTLSPVLGAVAEAGLWKLLNHLYKRRLSGRHPLEFFYSFMEEHLSDEECLEAPPADVPRAIRLLTIHGSKGLEFKNVIVFNLSLKAPARSSEVIYDSEKNRLAFSVPEGGRHKQKIKCYGHTKINKEFQIKEREESDRQLYVAMTRAKNSLCLLLPEGKRSKHNWFHRFPFFDKVYENGRDSWKIKEGLYKQANYSFLVERDIKVSLKQPSCHLKSPLKSEDRGHDNDTGKQTASLFKSSGDFILFQSENDERIVKEVKTNRPAFLKANVFFKTQSGNYMHNYLHLLSCQSYDKVKTKLKASFLSDLQKQELRKAMDYVLALKQPDMSFFLKRGFSEWPFQLKEGAFILRGRMDLWGWKSDKILFIRL